MAVIDTVGVGFTVTVKVLGAPEQPAIVDAVTDTVAVIAALVVFNAVNAPIFPVPLNPKPTSIVLVQAYETIPAGVVVLEKLMAGAATPLQYVNGAPVILFTIGLGLTETVTVKGVLAAQLPVVAITE